MITTVGFSLRNEHLEQITWPYCGISISWRFSCKQMDIQLLDKEQWEQTKLTSWSPFSLLLYPSRFKARDMWKGSKIILFEDSIKVAWSDPKEEKTMEGRGSFYFHIAQTHTQVMHLLKPTHNFFTYTTVTFTCKFREENIKRLLHIAMNRNTHISFTTTCKEYVCGNTICLIPRSHSRTVAVHKLYLTY